MEITTFKVLPTLPPNPKNIKVRILSMHAQIEEGYLEAYADIEEYVPYYPRADYVVFEDTSFRRPAEPVCRKGRVRLTVDALNELGNSMNVLYLVEESHIEWES